MKLFFKDGDDEACEGFVEETLDLQPMRIGAYCVLSSHWQLVLWPEHDGDLPALRAPPRPKKNSPFDKSAPRRRFARPSEYVMMERRSNKARFP